MIRPRIPIIVSVVLALGLFSLLALHLSLQDSHAALAATRPSVVDIGFSQAMLRHHEQAILMSSILLDGKPTGLTELARSIGARQAIELGQMRGWLSLWNASFQHDPQMTWMVTSGKALDPSLLRYIAQCSASGEMPGLASATELNRLRELEARDRDELFVELMLRHHEGGLPMARFAARAAELEPVRRLAQTMLIEQADEARQFRSILSALHRAQPAPATMIETRL